MSVESKSQSHHSLGGQNTLTVLDCRIELPKPTVACHPFVHSTQLRVFVDPDLLKYDSVNDFVCATGKGKDVFGATPADIVRVAGGVVTDFKQPQKALNREIK